jgi:hypothetical protein
MTASKTKELSIEKRVELANSVLKDTILRQKLQKQIAERREEDDPGDVLVAKDWLKAHDMICLCEQIMSILEGDYDITECGIRCDTTPEDEVAKAFETIKAYCKKRKDENASCSGCPVRKSNGTSQSEVCKLNQVARPSEID